MKIKNNYEQFIKMRGRIYDVDDKGIKNGIATSNFYKSMSISMKLNINCLGFLCGRSLWQDSIDIFCNQSNTEFIKWLENQGLERVEKLKSTLDL